MKEMFFAAAITFCAAVMIVVATKRGYEVAELEHAVTVLERELAHQQTMLTDAHRYYPLLERRVLQVETDYTAREVIWMMQDAFADCAKVEVY